MRKIEILAPAGSYEGMRAAMNAGCDAVYIGGSSFGARAYAENPEEEILLRAIDEAHLRDKKLYLTVNTLLKEKELTTKLYSFIEKYYKQGLDAVIVQDVGVMHFLHHNFPGLPIHASTQMTLTMAQGANVLKDCGVTRLVTSRELSFSEIKAMRENTDLEIETFVHGALCYCYSGQCLMSSMIGGRSGNRGRCAQPCRMPYQFYSEGRKASKDLERYLLSPKDINTIESIPEMIEAGINSFKIEGRMKRPEYAAAVASLYRKYVDYYLDLGKEEFNRLLTKEEYQDDMRRLQDVYNRGGFSGGYGNSYHGKSMMSPKRPNHSGVLVGTVEAVKGSRISIRVNQELNGQDILEIRYNEEEGYEFTVKDHHKVGDLLETNVGIRRDSMDRGKRQAPVIKAGSTVYRTKNNKLLTELSEQYLNKDRKLGIKGRLIARLDQPLALTLSYQDFSVTAYQKPVQEAQNQPVTKEKLTAQISKTGDTLYQFDELVVEADEHIFVPVAWLNDIRREAIDLLQTVVTEHYRRKLEKQPTLFTMPSSHTMDSRNGFGITVSVQTREQFETALAHPEITRINVVYDRFDISHLLHMAEQAEDVAKQFYLILPQICRQSIYRELKKDLFEILNNKGIQGILVKNFEEISLLTSLFKDGSKEILTDYNMYVLNREAKAFWREKGITHYTASVELNYQELQQLGLEDCDILVYGYLPLMISAQCLLDNTVGCKKCKEGKSGYLTDRLGKKFFVQTNCRGCYNIIYNGHPLGLHKQAKEIIGLNPRNIRLDFTIEDEEQMKQVLRCFIDHYRYGKNFDGFLDVTTGHFKRGVE